MRNFLTRPLFVFGLAVMSTVFLSSCATVVPVPPNKFLSVDFSDDRVRSLEEKGPPEYGIELAYVPFPEKDLRMPLAGEKNSFGVVVTPEFENAYRAYIKGDGKAALEFLNQAEKMGKDNQPLLWQVSMFRAQSLLKMGMASDAELVLEKTAQLEQSLFGGNISSAALRGETRVWLGDYAAAKTDFFQVIDAIGNWELPISYSMPPANLGQLILFATAQLRAYTGLAGLYLLQEDYENAYRWAQAAEKRFNSVHYITNHRLYGKFIVAHLDSYYGRAVNLTFLAAALLAWKGDETQSQLYFDRASGFFRTLNSEGGKAMIASLKAQSLARLGRYGTAEKQARHAIAIAIQNGLLDYIWRVETVLGKILYEQKKIHDAEQAFRNAQKSVEVISGALSNDRTKTRFGAGKDDIPYYLSKIDLEKKDYATLFEDLERGRARAFVDMLADHIIEAGRNTDDVRSIKTLDQQIIRQRLLNIAPGKDKAQGIAKEKALISERKNKVAALLAQNPELGSTMAVWTHSLTDVQKQLGLKELMVYVLPARINDNITLLLIRKDSVTTKTLDISTNGFRKLLKAFAASFGLDSGTNQPVRGLKSVRKKGSGSVDKGSSIERLQAVFEPLKPFSPETMYVVPSGEMHLMPWGLLDVDWPTIVLPTGGWLNRLPKAFQGKSSATNVVVGNPNFGGYLSQLPGAETEAYAVGAILGSEPIIGDRATEKTVRQRIGKGTQVLHLATHGIYNHSDPMTSAIFLTENGKASPITAKQIFKDPFPAKVIVLSACETGLGRAFAGEDTLGLLRSFYLGGTVTTLSSLWPVDDEGTSVFMQIFYEHAKNGAYGEGWLKARNRLKKMGYSPAVYSSFLLGGLSRTFH